MKNDPPHTVRPGNPVVGLPRFDQPQKVRAIFNFIALGKLSSRLAPQNGIELPSDVLNWRVRQGFVIALQR